MNEALTEYVKFKITAQVGKLCYVFQIKRIARSSGMFAEEPE